ncbi:MAG: hypothetical protein Q9157_003825, partial [Trypethelium eluteriae]
AQVAVELLFAVINELYTLSSAWTFRRTLLTAAKTFLLRPGNPQLETIRVLLQDTVITAHTGDAGVAGLLRKVRANALPTEPEMEAWRRSGAETWEGTRDGKTVRERKEELRAKARRLLVQRDLKMPSTASRKRAADQDTYEEDDFVENDDGRATKKSKRDKTSSGVSRASVRLGVQKDDDGLEYWELSKNRRVGISEFKGKRMINIREYYEKDGKSLPGKKGISLPIDQFTAFVEALPAIERVLRDKGETVPRPKFDDVGDDVEQDQKDDEEGSEEADDKKNFEATSDEDD